jgi:Na+/H+ antiporter NhaA
MSLFIANLAFGPTPALETAKIGILAASILSGMTGAIVLSKRNK